MNPRKEIPRAAAGRAVPVLIVALLVAVGMAVSAVAAAPAGQSGKATSGAEVKRALIGTWRLTSAPVRDQNGNVIGSQFDDPVGKLIYTQRGDVSAFIGKGQRTNPSDPQLWYTGTFDVRARAHEVVHHVRFSSTPAYEGHDLVRHYKLRGDRLALSFSVGPGLTGYANWIRAH